MKIIRKAGDTSNILQIFIQDSSSTTGAGLTGLTSGSAGLTAYYHKDTDTTATVINLVTMTVGTFTSSGFKEIDATNMPGWYQFCPPDAALSTTGSPKSVGIHLKGATNMAPLPIEVQLVGFDLQVATQSVSVTQWNGTNVSAPATAGIPEVNVKNINNVSAASVTTVNANQGTTQPINFTGTAGSALVKSDVTDIAGVAVSTSTAQLGVNVVNIGGAAAAIDANNFLKVDVEDIGGVGLSTHASGMMPADVRDIAGSAVSTSSAQLGVNVVNIAGQAAALDANNFLKVDIEAINANTTAAVNLGKSAADMGRGTCTTGGTTTSIPTSAFSPGGAGIVSGQFIGRTIIFDGNTSTSALQGQATNITANTSGATPTFTVTALTTAPSSGDTFSVV